MRIKYTIACIVQCLFLIGCVTTGPQAVSTPDRSMPDGAVAVWDLENVTTMGSAQPDLGDFLTARVLETIKDEGLVVVEREKLLLVLEELSLGASELSSADTQLRIGRLAGAKRMIFGGYQVIGKNMRIDLRMVETETGRVLRAAEQTVEAGDIAGWLSAAEEAARNLVMPKTVSSTRPML